MGRLLWLLLVSGCWRESSPAQEPASFVARVNARAQLQHELQAIDKRLARILEHIAVLRNETGRAALAADLRMLDGRISRLAGVAHRTPDEERQLQQVRMQLERVREELAHATTAEERAARQQLGKARDRQAPEPRPLIRLELDRRIDDTLP